MESCVSFFSMMIIIGAGVLFIIILDGIWTNYNHKDIDSKEIVMVAQVFRHSDRYSIFPFNSKF